MRESNSPQLQGIQEVFRIAVDSQGTYLATIGLGDDASIVLWDKNLDRQVRQWPAKLNSGTRYESYMIEFSNNGTMLASGGLIPKVWGVPSGELIMVCSGNSDECVGIAFTPDDRYLAVASYDGKVRVYDLDRRRLSITLRGHRRGVHSVAVSPDGKTFATCSDDQTVRLWNVHTGRLLHTASLGDDVRYCRFDPTGTTLYLCGRTGPLLGWSSWVQVADGWIERDPSIRRTGTL